MSHPLLVETVGNMAGSRAVDMLFWQAVVERSLRVVSRSHFSETNIDQVVLELKRTGWTVEGHAENREDVYVYCTSGSASLRLSGARQGSLNMWFGWDVASPTIEAARFCCAGIERIIPKLEISDPGTLNLSFWTSGPQGPVSRSRRIAVPSWEEIRGNYAQSTIVGLERVMAVAEPPDVGQLLLFLGQPGTGKTFAIRALLRQWQAWCNGQYVVDPEEFFRRAEYMMGVVLDMEDTPTEQPDAPGTRSPQVKRRWNLLIIEDADEFLTTDAKERSGQALGRLLNLTNGLIGQGLRLLVLMTTNEPIERLHPAIARVGRCMANVPFAPLNAVECAGWAAAHQLQTFPSAGTLAEMYGALAIGGNGKGTAESRRTVGF